MSQIVRFRRPEAPEKVCRMFVEGNEPAAAHVRRVEALGYSVVDVFLPAAGSSPAPSEVPR
jgi:hypothetical protein